jgi:hypothetical protein
MTKSKGIGRGGQREGAGRPRFGKTGKTSNFSTRISEKTRALLDAEARRRGESVSKVAEDLLQLGLEEMAAIRNPRPLKALLFLVEALSQNIPDGMARHLDDDSYSWRSNPYMFAAFRAAVISLLELLRPRGEIVIPPQGPLAKDQAALEPLVVTFPDSPDEYGRLQALNLVATARFFGSSEKLRGEAAAKWMAERTGDARQYYGLADAWEGLNMAIQRRGRK